MQSFAYSYPTRIHFGEHVAADALRKECRSMGKRVLLAYGCGSIRKNGIYDEIRAVLQQAEKEVIDFSGIMPNPTYTKVQQGAALVRQKHIDFRSPLF